MAFYWKKVTSKHLKGGKETRMDVLVMENLLYRRTVTRLYDLKGSSRSRYNADSTGKNKVLLDQNLIEAMPTSPIFVGNKAKRLLERAVWNDTGFLAVSFRSSPTPFFTLNCIISFSCFLLELFLDK
jgi:1-phosphatidylinositol-3-phosphate 5-kinase